MVKNEYESFKALKPRRKTRVVLVGGIPIGGDNPVVVQTMTNTDTLDIDATVNQILKCVEAGTEIIRITTPTVKHVHALGEIKEKLAKEHNCATPIVADIHFDKNAAFEALKYADKIRLNPGNLLDTRANDDKVLSDEEYQKELDRIEEGLTEFIDELKKTKKPIRIGANWGSLSGRVLARYGNTPEGLAESVMEYLRIFKKIIPPITATIEAVVCNKPTFLSAFTYSLTDSFLLTQNPIANTIKKYTTIKIKFPVDSSI